MKIPVLQYILTLFIYVFASSVIADDYFASDKDRWMQIAEQYKPVLHESIVKPTAVVSAVNDINAYQYWSYDSIGNVHDLLYNRNLKEVKNITLDFGRHITGYFSFHTKTLSKCQDAPIRIKFFFAEMPAELNTSLDPWKGTLSRAWMQDEIVTVTQTDEYITLPRRFSFRYLQIELLGASPDFDFALDDIYVKTVSSAGKVQTELLSGCPQIIRDIRNVSINTLRECMQTVYEDGPKRDRRLWLGDLYLEALANRYSFKNFNLTKRCLYLFAGLSDERGMVCSNCFELPYPHPQYGSICLSYSLLFNSTLLEYLHDTNDIATADDLWKVARRQMEYALTFVNEDGIYVHSSNSWLFFDWREDFDTNASMQGAMIFALNQTIELAKLLGRENEISNWISLRDKMKKAVKNKFFDKQSGVVISGESAQISVLSQAWLIKAGVLSNSEGKKAILNTLNSVESVKPGTPYATHYLIDAMLICGMNDEARTYLIDYWGGMVKKGADTFWEAYDPNDDFISPYGFHPLNSACHAWSCTPVYFIHKYPEIFQRP